MDGPEVIVQLPDETVRSPPVLATVSRQVEARDEMSVKGGPVAVERQQSVMSVYLDHGMVMRDGECEDLAVELSNAKRSCSLSGVVSLLPGLGRSLRLAIELEDGVDCRAGAASVLPVGEIQFTHTALKGLAHMYTKEDAEWSLTGQELTFASHTRKGKNRLSATSVGFWKVP